MPQQEHIESRIPPTHEGALSRTLEQRQSTHLLEPFIVLAKHKSLILFMVGGAALLTAVISLLLPKDYTAQARILPPKENTSIASAVLGQFGPLLGSAGKDLGIHNPNDMYVAMLRSRTVADALIDQFSLMSVYHKKLRVDARKQLDTLTDISAGRDDVISISVEDRDPRRAANIANAYVVELGELTKTLAVTDAAKRRLFFQGEVKTANDELAAAEDALKQTEEKTGIIQLDSQAKVLLEGYADLRAQVAAKEVQIQAMKSFATPENPDLLRAQQELAALRAQLARFESGHGGTGSSIALARVPEAGLEYVRKLREVKYRESMFELLLKQYEIARIDEAKDAALVQVLDRAVPPEKRSWPPRTALVVAGTLLGLVIAISIAFGLEWLQRANEDPQFTARWHLLKFYVQRRSKA